MNFILQNGVMIEKSKAEKYRSNEYANLAGLELPYPELEHAHEWNEDSWCVVCGADGRA